MIFSSQHFLQKTNERILLYYYEISGRLVFIRFLEEIEDTKRTFRNLLTFNLKTNIFAFICPIVNPIEKLSVKLSFYGYLNCVGLFSIYVSGAV